MAPMLFKFIALLPILVLIFSNTIGNSILYSTSPSTAPATKFGDEAGLPSSPSPTLNPTPVITLPLTTRPSPVESSRPETGSFLIPQPLQGQIRIAPAIAIYSLREPWSQDNLTGVWRFQRLISLAGMAHFNDYNGWDATGFTNRFHHSCPWLQGTPQSGSGATVCSAR